MSGFGIIEKRITQKHRFAMISQQKLILLTKFIWEACCDISQNGWLGWFSAGLTDTLQIQTLIVTKEMKIGKNIYIFSNTFAVVG